MKPGDCGGDRIGQTNAKFERGKTDALKGEFAKSCDKASDGQARNQGQEDTLTRLMEVQAGCQPDREGQGIDGEDEDDSAQCADAENGEEGGFKHVAFLFEQGLRRHHLHWHAPIIAENGPPRGRPRDRSAAFPAVGRCA